LREFVKEPGSETSVAAFKVESNRRFLLQEISFWLNLERALLRIQEKRESPEVALTLDVLKHGKRFHATVSFDTDTGLKQVKNRKSLDRKC
jgi:hypothetical protein